MDWNQCYAEGTTHWDKGAPAPALKRLLQEPSPFFQGSILVPGCGRGHDAALLAQSGRFEKIIALDIAPLALEQAANLYPESDGFSSISWLQGDILAAETLEKVGKVDALWEHTCLSAMPPSQRAKYAQAVAQLLTPGSVYAGIFYLEPGNSHEEGPPFGIQATELDELFGPHFKLREKWDFPPQYEEREGTVEQMRIYEKR